MHPRFRLSLLSGIVCTCAAASLAGHVFGLVTTDMAVPQPLFFAGLHRVFVYSGWLISAALLLALVLLRGILAQTACSAQQCRKKMGVEALLYVGANLWWLVCTKGFSVLALFLGRCSRQGSNKFECEGRGGLWSPFDISGHCFLAVHAAVLLVEELYVLARMSQATPHVLQRKCPLRKGIILWAVLAMVCGMATVVVVAWTLVFVWTCLFYHTVSEKLLGTACGLVYSLCVQTLINRSRRF